MTFKSLASVAAAVALLTGAVKADTLVSNGDFSQTTGYTGSDYFGHNGNTITDWTYSKASSTTNFLYFNGTLNSTISQGGGNSFTLYNSGNLPAGNPSGSNQANAAPNLSNVQSVTNSGVLAGYTGNYIVADGDPTYGDSISQLIGGLTVGKSYTLTFDWASGQQAGYGCKGAGAGYPNDACTNEEWQVSFGSDTYTTTQVTNPLGGFQPWQAVSTTFIATGTSELLKFMSVGNPSGYPPVALLADVSLCATDGPCTGGGTAAPEPASLGILGFGLAGLGLLRLRMKKKA